MMMGPATHPGRWLNCGRLSVVEPQRKHPRQCLIDMALPVQHGLSGTSPVGSARRMHACVINERLKIGNGSTCQPECGLLGWEGYR